MIVYIYLISIVSSIGIFGGGCTIYQNQLIVTGGATRPKPLSLNLDTFSLNLNETFAMDQTLPWGMIKGAGTMAMFPNLISNLHGVYLVGGNGVSVAKSLYELKLSDSNGTWIVNDKMALGSLGTGIINLLSGYSVSTNDNGFMYTGSVIKSDETVIGIIGLYKDQNWVWGAGPPLAAHTSIFYNNQLVLLGGFSPLSGILQPLNKLWVFDLHSQSWSTVTTNGDTPDNRVGLSSTLINDTIYVVGGASDLQAHHFPPHPLYKLNLSTLTWSKYSVPGFQGTFAGCLVQYKGTLIYNGGYVNNQTQPSTQFISNGTLLTNWNTLPTHNHSRVFLLIIALTIIFIIGSIYYKSKQNPTLLNQLRSKFTTTSYQPLTTYLPTWCLTTKQTSYNKTNLDEDELQDILHLE